MLNKVNDSLVPFENGEDLVLEAEHGKVRVQDVHLFHLKERLAEQAASKVVLRETKDDKTDFLDNNLGLVKVLGIADVTDQVLKRAVTVIPERCLVSVSSVILDLLELDSH